MTSRKNKAQKKKDVSKLLPVAPTPVSDLGGKGSNSSQLRSSSHRRRPTANSAMDLKPPGPDNVPVPPKLQKRFYEALVMLSVLGQNRGDRVDEEGFDAEPDPSDLGGEKLRRSFLRNLAYLCDFEKGGERTTAFALQETPQKIVYWMASNKGKPEGKDSTKLFAAGILETLKHLEPPQASEIEKELFEKAVAFSSKRISCYAKALEKEIQVVLEDLSENGSAGDAAFLNWLKSLKYATNIPSTICQLCYDSRRSMHYDVVRKRARAGEPCAQRYDTIRHLIGRLNHTQKAIKVMIEARLGLSYLFGAFEVKRAKSSHSSPPPLLERDPTLMEVAGRLARDDKAIELLRQNLGELDRLHQLSKTLSEECQSTTWRPRVHAELILLDLFWTQHFEFVGNDRYIGCSKPACYCCYHYITAHPGRFVPPACHNNLWLKWKAPDIYDHKETRHINNRKEILQKMAERIRVDVLAQIDECRGPRSRRPDSLTEISSHRQLDFDFLSDDPEDSSSESMSETDFSVESGEEDVVGNIEFSHHAAEEDSETEDDEAGGVQLLSSLTA